MKNNGFGPQNEEEERIFAEENFRIDVQVALRELMVEKGVTQKELARRLHVSESRVSQIFSDEFNMTVRKLAAFYHALGEYPVVTTKPQ
jgi:predicted XRE-type DNA-binding protein